VGTQYYLQLLLLSTLLRSQGHEGSHNTMVILLLLCWATVAPTAVHQLVRTSFASDLLCACSCGRNDLQHFVSCSVWLAALPVVKAVPLFALRGEQSF
jgi:hypothetical protein